MQTTLNPSYEYITQNGQLTAILLHPNGQNLSHCTTVAEGVPSVPAKSSERPNSTIFTW